jgi:hypothetical protein
MNEQLVRSIPPLATAVRRSVPRSVLKLLIVIAALAYGWLVYAYVSPYAGGSDSTGYLNFAQLLTQGHLLAPVRVLPGFSVTEFGMEVYQPQGFKIRGKLGAQARSATIRRTI